MADPKWTPGPWRINKYGSVGAGETGVQPIIAEIQPFYGPDEIWGSHAMNAHMIAAAPDLYGALYEMMYGFDDDATRIRAFAALAKASGKNSSKGYLAMPGPVSDQLPSLADRLRGLPDHYPLSSAKIAEIEFCAEQLDKSEYGPESEWSAKRILGAWARARRLWCEITGDDLI
jgi:hypothetical protein